MYDISLDTLLAVYSSDFFGLAIHHNAGPTLKNAKYFYISLMPVRPRRPSIRLAKGLSGVGRWNTAEPGMPNELSDVVSVRDMLALSSLVAHRNLCITVLVVS